MQTSPDLTPTNLYNPLIEDFKFIRADDNNVKHEYILRGQEITTLPRAIAIQGANDLAYYIVYKRGIKNNFELDKQNVLKEIFVDQNELIKS